MSIKKSIPTVKSASLSSDALKLIAIAAMLVDHIGYLFVDIGTVPGFLMRVIGRTTMPIMCFFIAEGYHYTRNVKKYAARLLLFAVISHVPFYYFSTGRIPAAPSEWLISLVKTSVMWPLLLGLCALAVWHSDVLPVRIKILMISILCFFAVAGDWMFFAIIWILVFDFFRGERKKQLIWFAVSAVPVIMLEPLFGILNNSFYWPKAYFQIGLFSAVPLLALYDGKRGKSRALKWGFYLFYPAHLIILAVIKYWIL